MADRSGEAIAIDRCWLAANPLPQPGEGTDKNHRGKVLVIGGSTDVPGGVRLTAEAVLRTGAGKVRIATVERAALILGVALPEASVVQLPTDGHGMVDAAQADLAPHVERMDAVAVGPAMADCDEASRLLDRVLPLLGADQQLVLDAAALMALPDHVDALRSLGSTPLLLPHIGEMAALLQCPAEEVEADRCGAVRAAAERYRAIALLKGGTSLIAEPGGRLYRFEGGSVGLATGGSGDVLAGIAVALLARGATPLQAMGWAVWTHGEAGRICGDEIGRLGFLASELLVRIPGILEAADRER